MAIVPNDRPAPSEHADHRNEPQRAADVLDDAPGRHAPLHARCSPRSTTPCVWRAAASGKDGRHDRHRLPRLARAGPPRGAARRPSSAPRRRASPPRCARTTSRRGASGRAQSAFAWSWLGAALATTRLPFGVVNAPGQRYHPAIVAQAIGDARRRCSPAGSGWRSGTGEASNEHITGDGWPRKERAQRPAARVRRRDPGAARRRGGQPRRPGHRRPGPAVDAARRAAAADRPRRSASATAALGGAAGPTG